MPSCIGFQDEEIEKTPMKISFQLIIVSSSLSVFTSNLFSATLAKLCNNLCIKHVPFCGAIKVGKIFLKAQLIILLQLKTISGF